MANIISNVYGGLLLLVTLFIIYHLKFGPLATQTPFRIKSLISATATSACIDDRGTTTHIYTNQTLFSVIIDGQRYPKRLPLFDNHSINFECLRKLSTTSKRQATTTRKKTILLWTAFTARLFHTLDLSNCPIDMCDVTRDRANLNYSDLVLVHMRDSIDTMPRRVFASQRLVHLVYESPINCAACTKYPNVEFDLFATYAQTSDFASIYWTNSGIEWSLNDSYDVHRDVHSSKSELAAALISNCDLFDSSMRLKYIEILNTHLLLANSSHSVRIYGQCGQACPSGDCRAQIARRVRFFLAFENSVCRDYVTEKMFDTLRHDVVPVVLGHGDYDNYVPRSAYINALDFESPSHLANYLLYLNANKTAYNAYFKWKRYVRFRTNESRIKNGPLCEMCIRLHLEDHVGMRQQGRRRTFEQVKETFDVARNCKRARYSQRFEQNISYVSDASLRAIL